MTMCFIVGWDQSCRKYSMTHLIGHFNVEYALWLIELVVVMTWSLVDELPACGRREMSRKMTNDMSWIKNLSTISRSYSDKHLKITYAIGKLHHIAYGCLCIYGLEKECGLAFLKTKSRIQMLVEYQLW